MEPQLHIGAEQLAWVGVIMLALAFLGACTWAVLATRLAEGRPLLPMEERTPVPWRWALVCGVFGLYLLLSILAIGLVRWYFQIPFAAAEQLSQRQLSTLLAVVAAAGLATTVITVVLLRAGSGATAIDLGLKRATVGKDVFHGLIAFAAAAPIVYGVKMLLTSFDSGQHPLEKMLRQSFSGELMFWAFVTAVVVAPLVEELMFRVVLQGWLERRWLAAPRPASPAVFRSPAEAPPEGRPAEASDPAETAAYVAPLEQLPAVDAPTPGGVAAITISAAIFAAFHIGHGPDPIPLFLLGLVLGYLYQRTHRLLPCVVLHCALNATSMTILSISLAR